MMPRRATGSGPQPIPTRRVALVIWASLLAGVLAFAVIATFVGPGVRQGPLALPAPEVLVAITLGLSVLMLVLSRVVPPRLQGATGARPEALAITRTIVAMAPNEAAALVAIVVWMLTGAALVLVPFALSLAAMAGAFPSEVRWAALCATPREGQPPRRMVR